MRTRAFACLLALAVAAPLPAITVTEVYIGGVAASEQSYVSSLLPIRVGDVFHSLRDLERKAALARSYLEQGGGFVNVEVEIEEISDTEAAVYVLLQSVAIGGRPVFGSDMTVFPHIPFYATGFGFIVGISEQLIGLDLPLARRLSADLLLGHSQTVGGVHAISAKAGLNYRPFPFLSLYLPIEADFYPASGGTWPVDVAVSAGGKIDFSYLESVYLFGASFEAAVRKGLADFDYTGIQAAATLSFRPFSFLSLGSTATLYALFGSASPLHTVDETGRKSLRVPPEAVMVGSGVGSISALLRIIVPWSADLKLVRITPSVYGFFEAWRPYEAFTDLAQAPYASSAGGGVMLELSSPFAFTFELGYGYSIAEGRSVFVFNVK